MSQGLWLLLLVVFLGLLLLPWFFLISWLRVVGLQDGGFGGRWVVFYGLVSVYLGFISVGAGRLAWSQELLLKGAVFSFLFGAVLGLGHWGVTRLPVFWQGFVKASLFCCMMAVLLMLFAVGVRDMDSIRGMFLMVLVLALLLKVFLGVFLREQSDTLLQRVLRVLNFLLFCCILALIFSFARWGAEHLGLSWLWFSSEDVLTIISTFFFILTFQGAKSARVMGKALFKRGVLMGR